MPRPLKFFGELHSMGLYHDSTRINALLSVGEWHRQHQIVVAACTKAAAVQFAESAGVRLNKRELRIMTGKSVNALEAGGLLEEGAIFVSYEGRGTVLRVLSDKRYEVVGRLEPGADFRDPYTLERA